VAWTGDPTGNITITNSNLGIFQGAGAICLTRINLPGGAVNGFLSFYWQPPSGGSPANSFVGLYNSAGTQLFTSTDLTATANNLLRLSMSLTTLAAGAYYVASLIGTQGTTKGGLAMFQGALLTGSVAFANGQSAKPYRASRLTGSATSLPSSLTYSSFVQTYYYVFAAID
jgi:hypothetical protein